MLSDVRIIVTLSASGESAIHPIQPPADASTNDRFGEMVPFARTTEVGASWPKAARLFFDNQITEADIRRVVFPP